jgi:YfiH family protein
MIELIRPEWPAPAHVCALTTTRVGGVSAAPFDTLNLGDHVGDDASAMAANRKILRDACAGLTAISWLEQVHGVDIVAADIARVQRADAQFAQAPGIACAIMTADCLPVLFCDRAGTQVAAAHAGWRGLCAGVLETTAAQFSDTSEVLAWLGPAIGPSNFEVGAEVRDQFLAATPALTLQVGACFVASTKPHHYLTDIYALARLRLRAAGVTAIYGGSLCTVDASAHFYSYRRDGRCGRMASLIYLVTAN